MNIHHYSRLRSFFIARLQDILLVILTAPILITGAETVSAATVAETETIGRTETVQVDVGNFYSRPSETASVIDTLKAGDSVTLLSKEGEWYAAKLADQRLGWVHQRLFTKTAPASGEATPSSRDQAPAETEALPRLALRLNKGWVRESPSFDGETKFSLNKGDVVSVVDTMEGWYFIQLEDGRNGWAYQNLFRPIGERDDAGTSIPDDEPRPSVGQEPPLFDAVVKVDSARVRELPTTNSGVRFGLVKGNTVSVLDTRDDWYFIRMADGQSGWAHQSLFDRPAEALQMTSDALENPDETKPEPEPETETNEAEPEDVRISAGEPLFSAQVKVDSGRVREAPTTQARVKFGLRKGDAVSVEDTRDGWYFIRLQDGRFGWGHQSLFSLDAGDGLKRIESIQFEKGEAGKEKILFSLSGFYPPKTFAMDEQIPKVVCDFIDTRMGPALGNAIPVGGDLVQRIRIGYHELPVKKVRVVIDLSPEKKYSVEQVFYKKTNLYALTFSPIESPAE